MAEIAPPPALEASGLFAEREAQAEARHTMAWPALVESIEPAGLPEPLADPPVLPIRDELAVLFEQSDEAVGQGENFRAIQLLRQAEALAPDHPALIRRFGVAYTLSGNRIRGAAYLKQAIGHDPGDIGVIVLLSQYAAQRGEIDAVLGYTNALDQAGLEGLANTDRAHALARLGYTAASADRLWAALRTLATLDPNAPVQAPTSDAIALGERQVLVALEPVLRQRLGDLYLSLDQIDAAAEQYAQVDLDSAADAEALIARRAYAALATGDQAAAVEAVVALLAAETEAVDHADLVGYLLGQGVAEPAIVTRLEAAIAARGVTLPLLAGLAQVSDQRRAVDGIAAWLSDRRADPVVLGQAVSLLSFDDSRADDAEPLADLLALAAGRMRAEPLQADRYAEAVLDEVDALVCLLRALRLPALANADDAATALLSAHGYARAERRDDAIAAYRRALTLDPKLAGRARLSLARLLIDTGRSDEAAEVLDSPAFEGVWEAFELRVRSSDSASEAGALIDDWERLNGEDLLSRLLRIRTTARLSRPRDACQSLVQMVAENPTQGLLYTEALQLIDDSFDRFEDPGVAYAFSERFVTMLIQNLPESPAGRLERAVRLYGERGRDAEMRSLLDAVIAEQPSNPRALALLALVHREAGDDEAANAAYERLLMAGPPGLERILGRVANAMQRDNNDTALAEIERLLALDAEGVLPGRAMTGDDAAAVLHMLQAIDPDADHEAVSLQMVRRFPDNPTLNNALGYSWTVRGENLLQAKAMIQRSLDTGGENHAVLDSMAWVLYKLGDFEQAQAYQRRAIEMLRTTQLRDRLQLHASKAVLYDHMGDIMYRQGDAASAQRHWQIALSQVPRLTPDDLLEDPELQTLAERVEAKINAVRAGAAPEVEPVPGPEAHGPDAHPADLPEPNLPEPGAPLPAEQPPADPS